MVRERAGGVEEDEAKQMIRDALTDLASMEGYMKATGVVKGKLECVSVGCAETQLVDLNEHCWWYVRMYLKVDDVIQES
ncbi:hypothetical protein MRX96_026082 [Rhipicephalus microplus]